MLTQLPIQEYGTVFNLSELHSIHKNVQAFKLEDYGYKISPVYCLFPSYMVNQYLTHLPSSQGCSCSSQWVWFANSSIGSLGSCVPSDRANMPAKYGRDLRCRACEPPPGQQQEDQEEQVEDQEHLECCSGYAELWDGLGPTTEESRVKYFMRVKMKRLRQQ